MSKRKIISIALVIIFLIAGVPICINETYNIGGYMADLNASDVLAYYGTMLGGGATLLAIFLTIRYENGKDERNRQKLVREKRFIFVANLLYDVLNRLNGAYLINLAVNSAILIKSPQRVYDFFFAAHSCINIDLNFTSREKILLGEAIPKIREYATKYSDLLWGMNNLVCVLSGASELAKEDYCKINIDSYNSINTMKSELNDKIKKINDDIGVLYESEYLKLVESVKYGINNLEQELL